MKRLSFIILSLLFCLSLVAQPKEVTLVVTGEGITKDEATNNALRSAVEQAFGVFVSANTEILNDEIVKDEIATISSGNVKTYKELAYIETPSGEKSITLQAVVSIGKLISYAENHGSSTEFAGNTFGANIRLLELNRSASQKAFDNLYDVLPSIAASMFDFKLNVKDPVLVGDNCEVEMEIQVLANSQTKDVGEFYLQSVEALSISEGDIKNSGDGNPYYAYYTQIFGNGLSNDLKVGTVPQVSIGGRMRSAPGGSVGGETTSFKRPLYLYQPLDHKKLNTIFQSAITAFDVVDNLGNKYTFSLSDIYDHVSINSNGEFGFDRIGLSHILLSGVYSILTDSEMWRLQKQLNESLVNGSELLGIVTSNTNYSPGKVVYTLKKRAVIDKNTVSNITGFKVITRL